MQMLKERSTLPEKQPRAHIACVLTALFLSVLYVIIGYGVCAGIRAVPEGIAQATIEEGASPFSKDDLVIGALAVRDYCFADHNKAALIEAIDGMNERASTGFSQSAPSSAPHADRYLLDEAAISHLDDVQAVVERTAYPIIGIAMIAAFLIFCTLSFFGPRVLCRALIGAGAADLIVIAVLLVWGLVNWQGLFGIFHTLFFEAGTWTFPADSLLITMLPTNFWIGLGIVWIGTSALLAAISLVVGLIGRAHMKRSR